MHDEPFPGRRDHRELRGQIAIGATNLTKQFGAFTAVKNVTPQVRYGEIYGLLGANGAGKTTTIKMLCGLLAPTQRRYAAGGRARQPSLRARCGSRSATCRRNFRSTTICRSRKIWNSSPASTACPRTSARRKCAGCCRSPGWKGSEDQLIGSLPQGWKQRVAFGAAILHEPSVLFLDEPTSGVDPLARRSFWTMINRLADAGTAILVTTHYLEEAEQCNRLGFMVAGELVTEGTPTRHQERAERASAGIHRGPAAARDGSAEERRPNAGASRCSATACTSSPTDDAATGERDYRQKLEANGMRVISVREGRFSLEDVFISVVEKARQEGKVAVGGIGRKAH